MFAPIFACMLGCGVQITTVVQAKASPEARREGRYEIVAGDPHVTPANPDFLAIAKIVGRALQAEGFEPAKSHEDSTVVVIVDWMTGDPVQHRRHIGGDSGEPQVRGAAAGMAGHPVGGTNNAGSFGFGADPTDTLTNSYRQTLTVKAVDTAAFKADPAAANTAPFGILRLLAVTPLGDKVGLPPEEDLEKRWQFGSASYERTAYLETRDWPLVAAQARQTGPMNPKWPVAVVSAGVTEGDEGPRMQTVQPGPALASDRGYVALVGGATHNGLLGAQYAPAIVQGIDFVLSRAGKGSGGRRETVMRNVNLASLAARTSAN